MDIHWNAYAYAGTKSDTYYAQVSGTFLDKDHWNLSNDFQPVLVSRDDGGNRDHSDIEDWRINVKAGFTPNATDEYAINYTTQSGEKRARLCTSRGGSCRRSATRPGPIGI